MRDLGLAHIQESKDTKSIEELATRLVSLRREVDTFRRQIIRRRSPEAPELCREDIASEEVGRRVYETGLALLDRERDLLQQIGQKKREVEAMQVWGQFEYRDLQRLGEAGYNICFYSSYSSLQGRVGG